MSPEEIITAIRADNGYGLHRTGVLHLCDAYEALRVQLETLRGIKEALLIRVDTAERNWQAAEAKVDGLEKKNDALCDSSFASGMLCGWNLCAEGDDETFDRLREQRMRGTAAMQKEQAGGT